MEKQQGFIDPSQLAGIKVPIKTASKPCCRNCPLSEGDPLKVGGPRQCRADPPQMLSIPMPQGVNIQGFSPAMDPNFWCGRHPVIQARIMMAVQKEMARLDAEA